MAKKKKLTLCLVYEDGQILLGMKKRGFGAGRWNGFGGKLQRGESIEEAAKRELEEEVGVISTKLEKRGLLNFEFRDSGEKLEVHVFKVEEFSGEPRESEEMKPQWFSFKDIPYDEMWPDDKFWLPLFLEGKNFYGDFYFIDENNLKEAVVREIRGNIK